MSYREIVWLASYPKSGNTWVRLFLEAYFLGEINLNEMVVSVADDNAARHTIGSDWDPRDLPVDLQQLTRPMGLLRLVLAYRQDKIVGVPLFVKTHNAHMIVNGIEQLPECLTKSVIYIVRDPRDVLLSYAKHMGQETDEAIKSMLDVYRVLEAKDAMKIADFISSWSRNVQGYMQADTHNVKIFKYEEMRKEPIKAFSEILEHAGVHPDRERIKRALDMCAISKMQEKEKEEGFLESSPKNNDGFFSGGGKIGNWHDKLSMIQLRKLERGCESMMRQLGYLEGKARKTNQIYPH